MTLVGGVHQCVGWSKVYAHSRVKSEKGVRPWIGGVEGRPRVNEIYWLGGGGSIEGGIHPWMNEKGYTYRRVGWTR